MYSAKQCDEAYCLREAHVSHFHYEPESVSSFATTKAGERPFCIHDEERRRFFDMEWAETAIAFVFCASAVWLQVTNLAVAFSGRMPRAFLCAFERTNN